MVDIGIQLSDKTGEEGRDIEGIINAINESIEKYNYRVKRWGEWELFRASCVDEERFVEDLKRRLKLRKGVRQDDDWGMD
jgi:hypothetical protein